MACESADCACHDSGDPMAMMVEIAATAPEHDRLKPILGTWNARVSLWWDPNGEPHESTGVMVNTSILGGRYIEHHYQSDDGYFQGQGLMGYNKTTQQYEGFWVDSMSTAMQLESGTYDPASRSYTMTSDMLCPMTKQLQHKRSILRIESDDRHVMESFFRADSGPELKSMEIVYTRKS